jgi:hypothetical protein
MRGGFLDFPEWDPGIETGGSDERVAQGVRPDGLGDPGMTGYVTTVPPLRAMTSVRCPRSTPRFSTLAPVASESPQAVERQRGDQCMLARWAQLGDQQRAEFVAV